MTYCTYADVKAYLKLQTDGDQTIVEDCIDRAQTQIETHTKRVFEVSADSARYFDAYRDVFGADLIFDHDICAITSVTNGDGTSVSSTKYITLPPNRTPYFGLRLKTSTTFTWTYSTDPENAIAVVGKWGFSQTPPNDIAQACIRLSAFLYRQRDNSIDFAAPQITQTGTMLMPTKLPADVAEILKPYIRLGL